MDLSDSDLVTRARAGDTEAFAALVQRYRTPITRLLRRLVGRAEEAEDLAQETLVAAFERLDSLRDADRFGPWVRAIALNAARQWWRHESQISFEPLWDETEPAHAGAVTARDAASERVRELVREALGALPPEPRSTVLLHYFAGYDYGETAALLDIPVSTVRGRLHVARRRLREEMATLSPTRKKSDAPEVTAHEFSLTSDDLAALRAAERIAGRDPERAAIQAICVEPDGTIVATDVHRLYLRRGTSLRPTRRVLIPYSLFAGLSHRPWLQSAHLTLSGTEATLRYLDQRDPAPQHQCRAPLLTGERFPRYERVIPTEHCVRVRLSAHDLLGALDEVGRFEAFLHTVALPDGANAGNRVTLTFSAQNGTATVQDAALRTDPAPVRWAIQTEIPVELENRCASSESTIAFNRTYLRECLHALRLQGIQRIEMRINGSHLPVVLMSEGVDDRLIVLMPMYLDLAEPTPLRDPDPACPVSSAP